MNNSAVVVIVKWTVIISTTIGFGWGVITYLAIQANGGL